MPNSRLDALSGVLNCLFIVLAFLTLFQQAPFSAKAESPATLDFSEPSEFRANCRESTPPPEAVSEYILFAEACLDETGSGMTLLDGDVLVMFHRLNELRRENGLQTFQWHAGAAEAAKLHAIDMLRRDYFAHSSPEGLSSGERLRRIDRDEVFSVTGENLAYYSNSWPDAYQNMLLQEQLEASPSHLENMLNPDFTHAGAAIVKNGYTYIAAQVFVTPEGQLSYDWPTVIHAGESFSIPDQLGQREVGGWRLISTDGRVISRAYDRRVEIPDVAEDQLELVILGAESSRAYLHLNGPVADLD